MFRHRLNEFLEWLWETIQYLAIWTGIILVIALTIGRANAQDGMSKSQRYLIYNRINEVKEILHINASVGASFILTTKGLTRGVVINGYLKDNNNGTFSLYINPALSDNEMIEWIDHEMIHVWQITSGRLTVYRNGWIFNGVFYDRTTPYEEQLHEIEAYGMSRLNIFNNR